MKKYKSFRKPYRFKRLKPTGQRRRKLKSIISNRFFWLAVLILIILGGIFYFMVFSPVFQVEKIKVEFFNRQTIPVEEIQTEVESQINKRIFSFPTKSVFLANEKEIFGKISKKFPQLLKINIAPDFPHTLKVKIFEREPTAVFYQGENYFFIDKEGIIFDLVKYPLSNGAEEYLKISNLTAYLPLNLGERVIKKEQISQILKIESKLKNDLKITLEEVLIISEERMNLKTAEGWEIYFNPKGDIAWQLTKLGAVLEKEIPSEERRNLEYIELRFGNFAPYKYH